jgi:hypothetical protein
MYCFYFTKEEKAMEVRIARVTTLLNKAVEGTNKSSNKTKDNNFLSNWLDDGKTDQNGKSDKKELSSQDAMMLLSSKGAKHSGVLFQSSDNNYTDIDAEEAGLTKFDEMTKQLKGLSTQVVNGQFSATDKMNFDTELTLLSALLKNADNESKCEILSERINNLSRIVNSAAVYSDMDLAVFKLIDPDYESDNNFYLEL